MIPLLYYKTLCIFIALKHLLSHLIPVKRGEADRAVIPALHTGEEDLRLRDLGGHKATWLPSANSIYSDWSRLLDLGYDVS